MAKISRPCFFIQGFSLIEVLIAIVLLSIVMLSFTEVMLSALHRTREAFHQSVAVEQLDGLKNLILQFPNDYLSFVPEWERENAILLPAGKGEINHSGGILSIFLVWRSGFSHLWRCRLPSIENYSCFELEIN